jgi:hypothetical protein
MYRELINALPIWQLIVFIMIGLIIIAYLAALIPSYWYKIVDDSHREVANTVIGLLSGGFFILLAFVIVSSWEYYIKASDEVAKEAGYVDVILRTTKAFPEDFSKKMYMATADYATSVRVDEWATMRKGKESPKAWLAINNMYNTLEAYSPKVGKEEIFYDKLIDNVNNLLEIRRDRLIEIDSIIPHTLRNALIIGSVVLAILLGCIRGERTLYNLLPLLFFAGILGFNLALALSFDYPYSGDISISNAEFYKGSLSEIPD